MSFIQPTAIKAIALSVDVTHLTDEAARALAPDVEYRLREVIQDSLKFARHSKRTKLTTQDVDNALRLRNIEPLYGFLGNNDPAKYVRATGHPDVYFVRDGTVPLEQITCAALPKAPNHTTVMPHWLFIDGVQPQTEENAAVERPPPAAKRPRLQAAAAATGAAAAQQPSQQNGQDGPAGRRREPGALAAGAAQLGAAGALAVGGAEGAAGAAAGTVSERVQLPVQHILSDEMQRLLEQIKQILGTAAGPAPPAGGQALWGGVEEGPGASSASSLELTPMQRAILATMQSDPGMQQLLPYLTKHVGDEVAGALRHLPRLHMVLRIVQALLLNPAAHLEPYLHQLMPPLLTCCMAKSLGPSPMSDHWPLRDSAAALVAQLCDRFGEPFYGLKVKVSKQLLRALLDGSKPLTSHYGAVSGLVALGNATVRLLLLPQLEPYLTKLQPALAARKEGLRQYEATRVYGAMLAAAGSAMYDKLVGAAADGLLPVHLFRASRPLRTLAGGTSQQGVAAAVAASGGPASVPPPPPNPDLDAIWETLRAGTPQLVDLFNAITSSPSAPQSLSQMSNLRFIAADASHSATKTAQAVLHQLAKQGIGLPAAQPVASPPAAQPPPANGTAPAGRAGESEPPEPPPARSDKALQAGGHSSAAASIGRAVQLQGEPTRSPRAILADSWREDADLGEVVWALTALFGPAFLSWLPQPPMLAAMNI